MSLPKRLCLLVFGLCGAFSIVALTLPWFGPWTREATSLLSERWYYLAVEAALACTALGVLVALLRALFTPRRYKSVLVESPDGDAITVTATAISSQVSHVVEDGGLYVAERVWVNARKRSVEVSVRVRPHRMVSVAEEGPRLHDALVSGLTSLVGNAVRGVNLEFVEPVSHETNSPHPVVAVSHDETQYAHDATPTGITVPMGHGSVEVTEGMGGETDTLRGVPSVSGDSGPRGADMASGAAAGEE